MDKKNGNWKILDLLKITENLFRDKSISNARLNAELLLARSLNTERIRLYTEFEKPVKAEEVNTFRTNVKRRLNFEPLQYILGMAHFYGREFKVNCSVLIPRPETEILVEKTIDRANKMNLQSPSILEVGTGSGCISISVAGEIDCVIDSADIDENSLLTAKENAEGYKLKGTVNFIKLDFLKDDIVIDNYNIVICNPPYIPKDEYLTLPEEIKNFEPEQALTDYSDGLEFYRRIFALYNSSKIKPAVLFEIGDGKKELVEKLLNDYSIKNFEFHKDLLNIFRVLEINC